MFKRISEYFKKRKERKMIEQRRRYANEYIAKFGLNQERDLAVLKEIAKKLAEKYNIEIGLYIAKQKKGIYINGERAEDDINSLVTKTLSMISSVYMNILMVYFGNLDNLCQYVALLFSETEFHILSTNKVKMEEMQT